MDTKSFLSLTALSLALSMEFAMITSFPAMAKSPLTPLSKPALSGGEDLGLGLKRLKFKLPGIKGSGNREPGAARDGCTSGEKKLTALVPTTQIGLTVTANPTLYFYIPPTEAKEVQLSLTEEGKGKDEPPSYTKSFTLSKTPGIVGLTLSDDGNKPALEVNKKYHWEFKLICDSGDPQGPRIDGDIKRMAQTPLLKNKLNKVSERDRPGVFAEEGVWIDTVKTLADLRSANPTDSRLKADWVELLQSQDLGQIAEEDLVK